MCDSKIDCTDGSDEKYCFKNPGITDDQNSDSTTKKPDFSTTETPIIIGNKTGKRGGRNLYTNYSCFFGKKLDILKNQVLLHSLGIFTNYAQSLGFFSVKKLSQMKDLIISNPSSSRVCTIL